MKKNYTVCLEASDSGKLIIKNSNEKEITFCTPDNQGEEFTTLFNSLRDGDKIEITFLKDEKHQKPLVFTKTYINSTTVTCIKHLRRYGNFTVPDCIEKILLYSLRGQSCKEDHLDISQRISLYDLLSSKTNISDPYIIQFLKDSKKVLRR